MINEGYLENLLRISRINVEKAMNCENTSGMRMECKRVAFAEIEFIKKHIKNIPESERKDGIVKGIEIVEKKLANIKNLEC